MSDWNLFYPNIYLSVVQINWNIYMLAKNWYYALHGTIKRTIDSWHLGKVLQAMGLHCFYWMIAVYSS